MKCDVCGKEFEPGNRPDGLPNGVGFVTEKETLNMCTDCIINVKSEKLQENGRGERLKRSKDG